MKRPAIQLYFGDLMKNPKVKRCGWPARGVLLWTMALLHDSDEYGAIRWPLSEIAQAVGCPLALMKELADKGALKGGDKHVESYRWAPSHAGKRGQEVILVPEQDGPLWYSSRMVRDEYKRTNRGVGTRFGPGGKLPTATPDSQPSRWNGEPEQTSNATPTRGHGGGASASSSASIQPAVEGTPSSTAGAGDSHGRSEKAHVNGKARESWHTLAWATASSQTFEKPRVQGESDDNFIDRMVTEATSRRRKDAADTNRRASH